MDKKLIFSVLITFVSLSTHASENPKYSRGECITPTDRSYSWFGKHARVEAFSSIDGFSGENYILAFPDNVSNNSIYGKSIENNTQLVNKEYCLPK